MVSSTQIYIVLLALFILGFGTVTKYTTCFVSVAEIVDSEMRQKYLVLFEVGQAIGTLLVGVFYYLIPHWRYNMMITNIAPLALCLLIFIFFLQETPKYLVKNPENAVKSLNRIAKINKGEDNVVTLEDINSVVQAQSEHHEQFKSITVSPLDLLRYKSLRTISFAVAAIVFSKRYVKFGPLILIDNLGVNIFVNQIVMALAKCIGCLLYTSPSPRDLSTSRMPSSA